jgi:hypothetical protein
VKRLLALFLSVIACLVTYFVTPPAYALSGSTPYIVTRCAYLSGISTYVVVQASGTMEYNAIYTKPIPFFRDIKITDPTLDVILQNGCGRSASPITVTDMKMTQGFYAHQCGINDSFALSAPFGVSAGLPAFHCGTTKVATDFSHFSANSSLYEQNNSGAPVKWTQQEDGSSSAIPWPCLHMWMKFQVTKGTSDDKVVFGDDENVELAPCS